MKSEVFIEIALVAVLAVFGVRLAREIRALDFGTQQKLARVDASQNMVFGSVEGIDPSGELINRVIPPGTKRFVVFGLRGSTIQEDMSFWSSVAALVPANSGVRVVGFCDGNACADAVRGTRQSSTFPVVAYGEAISSQAILNADAQGNFVLLDGGLKTLSRIRWRSTNMAPVNIVTQVLP